MQVVSKSTRIHPIEDKFLLMASNEDVELHKFQFPEEVEQRKTTRAFNVERLALWVAKFLGISDDSYSFERFERKNFLDKITEMQMKQHSDKKRLYYWIRIRAFNELREMLEKNPTLIYDRDCSGATPIHAAYLFEQYDIAHWLVEQYPNVAVKPYTNRIDPVIEISLPEGTFSETYMPYTGEILTFVMIFVLEQRRPKHTPHGNNA